MNSSGIKRGLAVSAISALAVAGIPALASPASADAGDAIQIAYTGPARDAGFVELVLETKGITEAQAIADLQVFNTALTSPNANTPTQTIGALSVVDFKADNGTGAEANEFGANDGFDEIVVRVPVDTTDVGGTAAFAIVFDDVDPGGNVVTADEARVQVSVTTAGPAAGLEITPGTQTAPATAQSSPYTVNITDAQGRPTNLVSGETVAVSGPAGVVIPDASIDFNDASRGSAEFTAGSNTPGLYTLTADGPNSSQATARLDVVRSAGTLTDAEVDIVTGADGWDGFGGDAFTLTSKDVPIRVDQTSVKIDIRSTAANLADRRGGTVVLTVTGGNGVTFGGKTQTTVSTTLDANGVGSLTITPDAGSIRDTGTIDIDGQGFDLQLDFARGAVQEVNAEAETYVSKLDGTVSITVVATDQFGLPVAGAYVDARRAGVNNDTQATPRQVTDANGKTTFTFTDVNARNNTSDVVTFRVFRDQFAAAPIAGGDDVATIRYTTEGTGSDFTLSLDGVNAGGSAYNPSSVAIDPLTDTVANAFVAAGDDDEIVVLDIVGGDDGAPATVSVDNGALILRSGEGALAQGAASESIVLPDTGAQALRLVGTKSGLVTVTVTSGGLTRTAQFTVRNQRDLTAARNVAVSGPADAEPGDLIRYDAVVTDAFGNPIQGFPVSSLNVQVSGPGALQDNGAITDATGAVALNVRVADDAAGVVTVRVQGLSTAGAPNQFGAAADQVTATSAENSGRGLTASSAIATASTTIEEIIVDPIDPTVTITGSNRAKDGFDKVAVSVKEVAETAGASVELWKINAQGKARRVKTKALNAKGKVNWIRPDSNGSKNSRYYVVVGETATSNKVQSKTVRIK